MNGYRVPGVLDGVLRGPLVTLAETRSGHPSAAVRALMMAVFEDGVRCYLGATGRTRLEAEQWVNSRQRRSPFSFIVVCESLGLSPSAVRTSLRQMRNQEVVPQRVVPRTRPYSRSTTRGRSGNGIGDGSLLSPDMAQRDGDGEG